MRFAYNTWRPSKEEIDFVKTKKYVSCAEITFTGGDLVYIARVLSGRTVLSTGKGKGTSRESPSQSDDYRLFERFYYPFGNGRTRPTEDCYRDLRFPLLFVTYTSVAAIFLDASGYSIRLSRYSNDFVCHIVARKPLTCVNGQSVGV
jgi:hypothetical protein